MGWFPHLSHLPHWIRQVISSSLLNQTGHIFLVAESDRSYLPRCWIRQVISSSLLNQTGHIFLDAESDRSYLPWCWIRQVISSSLLNQTGHIFLAAESDRSYLPRCWIRQVISSLMLNQTGHIFLAAESDRSYLPWCWIRQVILLLTWPSQKRSKAATLTASTNFNDDEAVNVSVFEVLRSYGMNTEMGRLSGCYPVRWSLEKFPVMTRAVIQTFPFMWMTLWPQQDLILDSQ